VILPSQSHPHLQGSVVIPQGRWSPHHNSFSQALLDLASLRARADSAHKPIPPAIAVAIRSSSASPSAATPRLSPFAAWLLASLMKHSQPNPSPASNLCDRSPHSRSGGCHSSHTHKTALAHQTGSRFAVSGGDSRDRRGRPGNTPPFPPPHPTATPRKVGVSLINSQSTQVQQLLHDGRRRIWVELENSWRWAGWLWAWLEQQPFFT